MSRAPVQPSQLKPDPESETESLEVRLGNATPSTAGVMPAWVGPASSLHTRAALSLAGLTSWLEGRGVGLPAQAHVISHVGEGQPGPVHRNSCRGGVSASTGPSFNELVPGTDAIKRRSHSGRALGAGGQAGQRGLVQLRELVLGKARSPS